MTRSKVKSRSHHDGAHLQPLTNVPTEYQLPTPWNLCKFKKQSYKDANINVKIKKNLQFYKAVFVYLLDKKGYNYLQFCVDKILHIL